MLVYDFGAGRRVDGDDELNRWFETFLARYPYPASEARPLDPQTLGQTGTGFELRRQSPFVIGLPLSRPAYEAYILTETNVAAAVRDGATLDGDCRVGPATRSHDSGMTTLVTCCSRATGRSWWLPRMGHWRRAKAPPSRRSYNIEGQGMSAHKSDPKPSHALTRREFLGTGMAAGAAVAAGAGRAQPADAALQAAGTAFPKGFLWGAATAAHQVEGNNINSDLWVLEHMKPSMFAEPSGDACDHYHRYKDDIALVTRLWASTPTGSRSSGRASSRSRATSRTRSSNTTAACSRPVTSTACCRW